MEMPLYQSHKKVRALKIKEIRLDVVVTGNTEPVSFIIFEQEEYGTYTLTEEFIAKHKPEVGGYLVRYEDGYLSYSPAKAFEEGYTLIEDGLTVALKSIVETPSAHLFHIAEDAPRFEGLLHSAIEKWRIKDIVTKLSGVESSKDGRGPVETKSFEHTVRQSEKGMFKRSQSDSEVSSTSDLDYSFSNKDFTVGMGVVTKHIIEFEDRHPLEIPEKFYHRHWPRIGGTIVKLATGQYDYQPSHRDFEVLEVSNLFGNHFITVDAPGRPTLYVAPKIMHGLQIKTGDRVLIDKGEVTAVIRDDMVQHHVQCTEQEHN